MGDIVERLRQGAGHEKEDVMAAERIMDEAAAEIERQQADIDKLLDERQGWLDEIERLRAELQYIWDNGMEIGGDECAEVARRALEEKT